MSYDINLILDRLCAAFPAVLDRRAPKPLKIGLGEDLLAQAGVHPALLDLTRTQIRRALKVYTGAPAYRKAVAAGGPRYDLSGQPAGEITPDQQAFAKTPRRKPAPAAPDAAEPATPPKSSSAKPYLKLTLKRRISSDHSE